ncbi:hypothetical protein PoB_005946300 [Plakobranchus ocellatus]|uniref:Uncharacterized protein n=1 Tax=Plakobranchus ocellatus TaxID=259542 RepID=A0AAV4CM62_9GAST|nr:hypothetical protein PoB_005946300 [Plakobranchus ocellatus]
MSEFLPPLSAAALNFDGIPFQSSEPGVQKPDTRAQTAHRPLCSLSSLPPLLSARVKEMMFCVSRTIGVLRRVCKFTGPEPQAQI